jgi:hypothetical protein
MVFSVVKRIRGAGLGALVLSTVMAAACGPPVKPSGGQRSSSKLTTARSALTAAAPAGDPIAAVGHGVFFDRDGRPIKVTADSRRAAQDRYLDRLKSEASPAVLLAFAREERFLAAEQPRLGIDDATARSFLIGWLIEQVRPSDRNSLHAKNAAIRASHLADEWARTGTRPPDTGWGLPAHVLKLARDRGYMPVSLTGNSGQKYIDECRLAGVPIPPTWDGGGWTDNGALSPNFLGGNAKVFTFQPSSPEGLCIALPRYSGDTISLLGIICMGKATGNVCFWDRSNTPVGDDVPLTGFKGGTDLLGGDVCSDCHAGENPFVVHPGSALDLGAALKPDVFQNPLVPAGWPTPGPNTLIGLVPLGNDQSCLGCHNSAETRRFPQLTPDLPGYCSAVLGGAVGSTMPSGPDWDTHINALKWFCDNDPPEGGNVPGDGHNDDPKHVGAPIVIEPIYGCAEKIQVRNLIYGGTVDVYIDGTHAGTETTTNPDAQPVDVPKLVPGQVVTATQTVNGVLSDTSAPAIVHDHKVDFPDGLPKPTIDPTLIYRCGHVIAVRHLQGAKVTVYVNGGSPTTTGPTSGAWTNVKPAISPFNLGDAYSAEYKICDDVSPPSDPPPPVAVEPPATPTPEIDPVTLYAEQPLLTVKNLLNGALTTVGVSGFSDNIQFSTAVDWQPNIDLAEITGGPLTSGQTVLVESALCSGSKRTTGNAQPCSTLPAPVIQQPLVGNDVVLVTQAVPGARILIWDQNDVEIGDGSGAVIALTRSLAGGDVLTVRQQLGSCTSAEAYQVEVMCYGPDQGC